MDYEKKYKEALKKAEAFYYSATTEPITEREVLANIFPELKESEDEKIRKNIIIALKSQKDELGDFYKSHNTSESELVDWLEKQGEKKETACDRCRKAQPNGSCQDITALGRCYIEGEQKVKDTTVIYHESSLKALEKSLEKGCTEGEQKNFDYENANIQQKDFAPKQEPKFKVGDLIVNDYCMGKVIELTDDAYLLDTGQGILFSCEHNAHLWSIEDAKAGDVLVTDDMIVLLKKRLENDSILTYFHYDTIDGEYELGAHLYYAHIYPATKEQCDLLFQKMKEAGYEWDVDKLIKVPKPKEPEGAMKKLLDEQDKFYKEAKIVLENKDTALAFLRRTGIIDEYGELAEKYRSNQTPATTIIAVNGTNSTAISDGNTSVTSKEVERQYCTGQYEPDVGEFPIEWKQENVDELSEFERAMMHIGGSFFGEKAGLDPNDTTTIKEQAKLLLELVTKQEWSEEDEKMLNSIIHSADNHCYINVEERNWLKSLKERYIWKPSDEQIKALRFVKKANAPEKIFICDYGSEVSYEWHSESEFETKGHNDIEYTRTDAFIKKAKEAFCKATCNGHPPRSTCTSLDTCKEHDNFVKYMKEE